MRRAYEKPVMTIEAFIPSVAVASCQREWSGEVDTSWEAQPITCCRRDVTTDYIFASKTTGCQYEPCHMIYIANGGTYTISQLNDLGLNITGTGGNVTVPDGGGYVLCWQNGSHYGPATPEIVKVMTSSF